VNIYWIGVLAFITGVVLASAFSAIVVYAQELVPGNVGMIAGLFFGFAFGMGAICSAVLGRVADATSLEVVFYIACASPLIGFLTYFLPDTTPNAGAK
jgi:FSR family fosmidomycin resistance protein-like MFS transporter